MDASEIKLPVSGRVACGHTGHFGREWCPGGLPVLFASVWKHFKISRVCGDSWIVSVDAGGLPSPVCPGRPGEGDRVADAAGVDAEEDGGVPGGQAEMVAEAEDEDVGGDVGAEAAVGAGPPDGIDAASPAPEVVPVLAVGVERDFQRGCQRFQVAGPEAGEGGMVQGVLPGPARGRRGRLRWRGAGEQGAVPLAVPFPAY